MISNKNINYLEQILTKEKTGRNVILTDFFDTIVHRTVHPNYVLRLWSKLMIREFGICCTIDELYFIRKEATGYLVKKTNTNAGELSNEVQILEVYNRLINNELIQYDVSFDNFINFSEFADYKSEIQVQFLNKETIDALKQKKNDGFRIYCVSDFYTSEKTIADIIRYHNLSDLFDGIYVSSERGKSKHNGGLYKYVLEDLNISGENVLMVGDNFVSDVVNAKKYKIKGIHIPNKKQKSNNKWDVLGNDQKDYKKVAKTLVKNCNKKNSPVFSEYILFFSVFVERLYAECKRKRINNLFFLAREGLYLKKLFDYYQLQNCCPEGNKINTHYLKASRQSALQVSFKELGKEEFQYFKKKYKDLSLYNFLKFFNFSEVLILEILSDASLNYESNHIIENFFESEDFLKLKNSAKFIQEYNKNRIYQRNTFKEYLNSYDINFLAEGIWLVDVGWGGSMQDCIFGFFDEQIDVNGFYLGLKEVYNITKRSKRYGLNFSAYPYSTYSDEILMANTEIYEQLLSAPHGSTIAYKKGSEGYTVEYYEESEKEIFEKSIQRIQDFMFSEYKSFLNNLEGICYDNVITQKVMTNRALKIGVMANKKEIKSLLEISKGFYDNLGNKKSGEKNYYLNLKKGNKSKNKIKEYLLSPEKMVKYLTRVKLTLFTKGKYFFFPNYFIYFYIKFSAWLKKIFFRKYFYLKFSFLR